MDLKYFLKGVGFRKLLGETVAEAAGKGRAEKVGILIPEARADQIF